MPSISIAEELAKKQREISISEFFERNKQILGYDSATKALLTAVKEGVDNSLDAGADADILPDILVEVRKIDKDEFVVVVEDNGPGIVKKEVANVFGRLLYGSRFFSRAQRRGQQGLGISGAVMYGQITTGKPTKIRSKVAEQDVAYEIELILDTKKNRPNVVEEDFVRVSPRVAKEICDAAGLDPDRKRKSLVLEEAKALHDAMQSAKLMSPPTDCLSPIGERLIKRGLKNVLGNLRPEFYAPPLTRDPAVYSGNPFQVEVGIVYGGDLTPDQPSEVLRFANRVPLLYQAGGCALTQAVANVDWRRYGLEASGGQGLPFGPAIVLVHLCSTKVPYTSESKEAVATADEIMTELDLALKEAGRRLKTHLTKKAHRAKTKEKFEIVQLILPRIADKSAKIVNKKVPVLDATEYDESDIYVSGINPGLVIGAEPLPGDWELNYAEFEGEEAPASEAEEEGEIDYDETEEALDDE